MQVLNRWLAEGFRKPLRAFFISEGKLKQCAKTSQTEIGWFYMCHVATAGKLDLDILLPTMPSGLQQRHQTTRPVTKRPDHHVSNKVTRPPGVWQRHQTSGPVPRTPWDCQVYNKDARPPGLQKGHLNTRPTTRTTSHQAYDKNKRSTCLQVQQITGILGVIEIHHCTFKRKQVRVE